MAKKSTKQEALAKGGDMDADNGEYDDDKEYDENGEVAKGGGYRMKKGQLYKMAKSQNPDGSVTTDDLEKSLDKLSAIVEEGDAPTRKEALLSKAMDGSLSDEENVELRSLLGGEGDADDGGLAKAVTANIEDNESLQKSYEVSDFLREQGDELTKSLQTLAEHVEASDSRQHEFNLVLAKAVAETGRLVKSLADRVGVAVSAPVRAPKSVGVRGGAQPMAKSFAGQPGDGEQLSKSQILEGMLQLQVNDLEKGGSGASSNGIDLCSEIAKFEQTGNVHPSVLDDVRNFYRQRAS